MEVSMASAGVATVLIGFIVAVAGLGLTESTAVRLILTLAGIAISLFGILGVINPAYQKRAVWKH
jgi:hypothetical protein